MAEALDLVELESKEEPKKKRETIRIEPKHPTEMSVNEIKERMQEIKPLMRRAVRNFEFYYCDELKSEMADLQRQLELRNEGVIV